MLTLSQRHLNDCSRCPVIGEETRQKDECYQLFTLVFDIRIAREMVRPHVLHRVDPQALVRWIECTQIVEAHVDHLPEVVEPGVMVTLPSETAGW